jgi:hypothetical protein
MIRSTSSRSESATREDYIPEGDWKRHIRRPVPGELLSQGGEFRMISTPTPAILSVLDRDGTLSLGSDSIFGSRSFYERELDYRHLVHDGGRGPHAGGDTFARLVPRPLEAGARRRYLFCEIICTQ